MERINIAELLKDCPQDMELYSPIFGTVYLDEIRPHLAIVVVVDKEQSDFKEEFLYDGRYGMNGECMLFPKGKTTWEGFVPPIVFKDGDIITCTNRVGSFVSIFKEKASDTLFKSYVVTSLCKHPLFKINSNASDYSHPRFATEEEKQQLFEAIKANGYHWNAETKTLEKLNVPKFKIGVRIKKRKDYISGTIINISDDGFYKVEHQNGGVSYVNIAYQDEWELVPVEPKFKVGNRITNGKASITIGYIDDNYYYEIGRNIASRISITEQEEWRLDKFDITTLKPFESKVLVRHNKDNKWGGSFFSYIDKDFHSHCYKFVTTAGKSYPYCIPYENNEHLLGKTDDCEEYYKTWE